ncbi:hypothetical protein K2X14_14225 [Acetobacter sp. TBRC 12305]|uniref:Type II secretion system protein GspF domain-containing protein n=1 Tax=Acetobacter garciniae TaxID=2817435 RepID=A0A939HPI0_9PROT|nr:hypothetical protein [Acetobacter garciniae]MBO1326271.1 hypothetical protein [Acetobacter garciniae]MBX0345991.1 hypothetical protein [Acetobacter garciniae]
MALHIDWSGTHAHDTPTGSKFSQWIDRNVGFSQRTRLKVYAKLAVKIEQGEPIERTLLREAARRAKRRQPATARVLRQIEERIRAEALALPFAIRPFVPADEFLMLRAGDQASDLPGALRRICDTKERTQRIMAAVRKISGAPLGYIAINIGFIAYLAAKVFPSLQTLSEQNHTQSVSLRTMILISHYATVPVAILGLVLLVLMIALVIYSLPRLTGRARLYLEYLPPWSTYRDVQAYLWITGFISYLMIGTPDTEALKIQMYEASPWLRERLSKFESLMIRESLPLPAAMEEAGFRFPSADIIDDIDESWGGEADYERILSLSKSWIVDIEERAVEQATAIKILATTITILISGYILVLGTSIGTEMQPR